MNIFLISIAFQLLFFWCEVVLNAPIVHGTSRPPTHTYASGPHHAYPVRSVASSSRPGSHHFPTIKKKMDPLRELLPPVMQCVVNKQCKELIQVIPSVFIYVKNSSSKVNPNVFSKLESFANWIHSGEHGLKKKVKQAKELLKSIVWNSKELYNYALTLTYQLVDEIDDELDFDDEDLLDASELLGWF